MTTYTKNPTPSIDDFEIEPIENTPIKESKILQKEIRQEYINKILKKIYYTKKELTFLLENQIKDEVLFYNIKRSDVIQGETLPSLYKQLKELEDI